MFSFFVRGWWCWEQLGDQIFSFCEDLPCFQVPSWTDENPISWPGACCVFAKFLGVLGVHVVVLVQIVIHFHFFHHAHEDDSVETRVVDNRRNVMIRLSEQLLRSESWIDVELAIEKYLLLMPYQVFDPPF